MDESGWAFGESIIALIEPVQPSTMIMGTKHSILHQFISLSSLASMAHVSYSICNKEGEEMRNSMFPSVFPYKVVRT